MFIARQGHQLLQTDVEFGVGQAGNLAAQQAGRLGEVRRAELIEEVHVQFGKLIRDEVQVGLQNLLARGRLGLEQSGKKNSRGYAAHLEHDAIC